MARIQLEDLRDAFGGDLLSLIAGHDIDADRRQGNREFVSSGNCNFVLGIHGGRCRLASSILQPPIPALVLP
jgi:hypothetical protein